MAERESVEFDRGDELPVWIGSPCCIRARSNETGHYDQFVRVRELFHFLKTQESLRICSKKSSEEEPCYAASETQLKGKASKQSRIRFRNRWRLFGVIDQRIGRGYTAAK
jgi:hypothetical protein